jgi:hypothetical protein
VAGAHSGAVPWVVADAGVLVDVRDPSAMAAAALQLLRDPSARHRLGDAARRSVRERFSRAAVAAATEAIYLELLPQPTTPDGAGMSAVPAAPHTAGQAARHVPLTAQVNCDARH